MNKVQSAVFKLKIEAKDEKNIQLFKTKECMEQIFPIKNEMGCNLTGALMRRG